MAIQKADLLIPLPPMSKPRPRSTGRQVRPYMDKTYTDWKANVRACMGEWWTAPPLAAIDCLVVHFYGPARGDLDNRIGAVMDAGLGLLWLDDNVRNIKSIAAVHIHSPTKEARIHMKILWRSSP